MQIGKTQSDFESLNPYSNGIYSMRVLQYRRTDMLFLVLILILMEYTL